MKYTQELKQIIKNEEKKIEIYYRLLKKTIDEVGIDGASEEFVITTSNGETIHCSPLQFVEIEGILLNGLKKILKDSSEEEFCDINMSLLKMVDNN